MRPETERLIESIQKIEALWENLSLDMQNSISNRTAAQRARVKSVALSKLFKEYRKVSLEAR